MNNFIFWCLLFIMGCSKEVSEDKKFALRISGEIQLKPDLAKHARESDVIYLIARVQEMGPPVAVMRFTGKKYPYAFTLTEEHLMIQTTQIDSPLNLSVRVDKDGDAMTKKPGDLLGTYEKNPVSLHSENIALTVNQIYKP